MTVSRKELETWEEVRFTETIPLLDEIYVVVDRKKHESGYELDIDAMVVIMLLVLVMLWGWIQINMRTIGKMNPEQSERVANIAKKIKKATDNFQFSCSERR